MVVAAMLVREGIIEFQNSSVDSRLELIDLPGLEANVSIDGFLSNRFMKNLDAAIVFQALDDFASPATEEIRGAAP